MFEVEESERGLQSHGPFYVHKLSIDGVKIPRLTGKLVDGTWHFCLDERFGCEVPEQYGNSVAWMIANALAIGAGYSHFGKDSRLRNPFKTKIARIGAVPDIEALEASDNAS